MIGELSQHKVEKNEDKTDYHMFVFYNKNGVEFTKAKLCFSYTETFDKVIENVVCESPSKYTQTQADNFLYDIKIQIESVTVKSIYGEITFI